MSGCFKTNNLKKSLLYLTKITLNYSSLLFTDYIVIEDSTYQIDSHLKLTVVKLTLCACVRVNIYSISHLQCKTSVRTEVVKFGVTELFQVSFEFILILRSAVEHLKPVMCLKVRRIVFVSPGTPKTDEMATHFSSLCSHSL